jgi:hypothetical protein
LEIWNDIKTDIDFSEHTPISTASSLHIYDERYEIDGKTYRLLYALGSEEEPHVQVLN